jgi:hypothetical protein
LDGCVCSLVDNLGHDTLDGRGRRIFLKTKTTQDGWVKTITPEAVIDNADWLIRKLRFRGFNDHHGLVKKLRLLGFEKHKLVFWDRRFRDFAN